LKYFITLTTDAFHTITLSKISTDTYLTTEDIASTLYVLEMLVKDGDGKWRIRVNLELCQAYIEGVNSKGFVSVDSDRLQWTPSVYEDTSNAQGLVNDSDLTDIEEMQDEDDVMQED
jgi:hypothetical protein